MRSIHRRPIAFLYAAADSPLSVAVREKENPPDSARCVAQASVPFAAISKTQLSGDLSYSNALSTNSGPGSFPDFGTEQPSTLPAPVCLGKPGMLSDATPNTMASLALRWSRDLEITRLQRETRNAGFSLAREFQSRFFAGIDLSRPRLIVPDRLGHR